MSNPCPIVKENLSQGAPCFRPCKVTRTLSPFPGSLSLVVLPSTAPSPAQPPHGPLHVLFSTQNSLRQIPMTCPALQALTGVKSLGILCNSSALCSSPLPARPSIDRILVQPAQYLFIRLVPVSPARMETPGRDLIYSVSCCVLCSQNSLVQSGCTMDSRMHDLW